jgi:hypothetical protein
MDELKNFKTIQFVVIRTLPISREKFPISESIVRNQCRNKCAFRRYPSCRSVFGLRRDIGAHPKWITIYPYLSKNQMDNHLSILIQKPNG